MNVFCSCGTLAIQAPCFRSTDCGFPIHPEADVGRWYPLASRRGMLSLLLGLPSLPGVGFVPAPSSGMSPACWLSRAIGDRYVRCFLFFVPPPVYCCGCGTSCTMHARFHTAPRHSRVHALKRDAWAHAQRPSMHGRPGTQRTRRDGDVIRDNVLSRKMGGNEGIRHDILPLRCENTGVARMRWLLRCGGCSMGRNIFRRKSVVKRIFFTTPFGQRTFLSLERSSVNLLP